MCREHEAKDPQPGDIEDSETGSLTTLDLLEYCSEMAGEIARIADRIGQGTAAHHLKLASLLLIDSKNTTLRRTDVGKKYS